MRKYMTKEVTFTKVNSATIKVDETGLPVTEKFEEEIMLGNVNKEKAEKRLIKKFNVDNLTVYAIETFTQTYQMKVEDFIKYAEIKTDDTPDNDEEEGDDNE